MKILSFIKIVRTIYRLRKFIAAAVVAESIIKKKLNSSSKKSKNSPKQEEFVAMTQDLAHRAQSYIQNIKKQYARR